MTSTGLRDRAGELLPCPFCGAQPVVWNDGEDWIAACVGVATCHAEPGCVLNKTRDEAIRKWNTRAPRALLASPAPAGAEGCLPKAYAREARQVAKNLDNEKHPLVCSRPDAVFFLNRIADLLDASPATPPAEAREGHWTDRYQGRPEGAYGWLSDEEVANKVRMLGRSDLDHEAVCTMARDRIAQLSREVRDLRAALPAAPEVRGQQEKPQ